jgi:hippurate hydrolase
LPKEKYPLVTLRNESIPATYNQPELTARIEKALISRLGQEKVFTVPPVMGGEDFSMYGRTPEKIPISLFWLGVVPPEKAAAADRGEVQLPSLHSPFMLPDYQPAIRTGVSAMTAAVLDLLKTP